jgi:hypothetical protein
MVMKPVNACKGSRVSYTYAVYAQYSYYMFQPHWWPSSARSTIIIIIIIIIIITIISLALQPSAGYGLLVTGGFVITHNDAPQAVGLLWTSDQLVAGTST